MSQNGFALTKIARDLERMTESGTICCECGSQFVKAHGHRVACGFCWKRLSMAEQRDTPLATHEELNKATHATEARKRKARKESQ